MAKAEFVGRPIRLDPRQIAYGPTKPSDTLQPNTLIELIGAVGILKAQEKAKIARGEKILPEDQLVSLAGGLPPASRLEELWGSLYTPAAAQLREKGVGAVEATQYGSSEGNPRLRTWAAQDVSELTGRQVKPEEILTFPGLQYGISDAILTLCTAQKKILITSMPTYSATLEAAASPIDTPVVGVESDEQGIIPESLEHTLMTLRERQIEAGLVYGMVIGNPTGTVMSDERGRQINEICKKYGVPFFVDYAYYHLQFSSSNQPQPMVSYYDENVILGFTTSKIATPGERVAYAAIKDPATREALRQTKASQMILTPPKNELDFWLLATRDGFSESLSEVRAVYEEGIKAGLETVAANRDILQIDGDPQGGMFLYARVPDGISTSQHLGEILSQHKIAYAPGLWFQPRQIQLPDGTIVGPLPRDNYMRLCAVTESPETVKKAIERLAQAFREIARRDGISLFPQEQIVYQAP